jgi:4-amino-4-deoxy-L-arabinose transferase-like glycosyltransferase
MIMVHSWAMSEALYISLMLSGILIYTTGHAKGSWKTPFFSGLFFGLAAATRYIGVSLLLAGGIVWLFAAGKRIRVRFRNVLLFGLVGITPLLLWIIRNQILAGQPTNRIFELHLMSGSMWISLLNTMLLWFIPGRLVHGKELLWLGAIILLVIIGLSVYFLRKRGSSTPTKSENMEQKPVILLSVSILAYLAILIISRSFFDVRIPMDERLLSPVLAMGLILLVWILEKIWNFKRWLAYGIVAIVSLMLLFTNLARSTEMVQNYHAVGRGYASARDHVSETYAYLRNRPDVPIYSNAFTGIYFWTNRMTNPLPSPGGISAMKESMKQTGAYLVLFDSIPVELYGTTRDELTQGLLEVIRLSEATIYKSP